MELKIYITPEELQFLDRQCANRAVIGRGKAPGVRQRSALMREIIEAYIQSCLHLPSVKDRATMPDKE